MNSLLVCVGLRTAHSSVSTGTRRPVSSARSDGKMVRRAKWFGGFLFLFMLVARPSSAQTSTYHLHGEASSTSGFDQLKTAGPDAASTALQTANLKSAATGSKLIKEFDTQSGDPNTSGVVPSGSSLTFTLWMKKTANFGTMFPQATVKLNNASGTTFCSATGSTALTTTLTQYTLTCTTTANISMATTDRFYLWTGVSLTVGSSSGKFAGEIDIEGTLNGNYDSQIVLPSGSST